jgi:hypothetical protein
LTSALQRFVTPGAHDPIAPITGFSPVATVTQQNGYGRNKREGCEGKQSGVVSFGSGKTHQGASILLKAFAFLRLPLPAEHPRLGRDLLRFGDHTFLLIEN